MGTRRMAGRGNEIQQGVVVEERAVGDAAAGRASARAASSGVAGAGEAGVGEAGAEADRDRLPNDRERQPAHAEAGCMAADAAVNAAADAAAGAWLLRAVGTGAVLALLHELSGNGGFRPPWDPVDLTGFLPGELHPLHVILPMLLPVFLIFCAYFFVARTESRLNVQRQRGALALLGFAAVFPGFALWSTTFSGVYGVALLALAVRTRETLTVATGAMALAAYVVSTFLSPGWVVLPVLGLMAVAAFFAAWRVGRNARGLLAST